MHVQTRTAVATAVIAATLAGVVALAVPALAHEGDLDCGDPGTFHNMPVQIGNDPHGLDANQDGIGCEDPAAFGGEAPSTPAEPAPSEPASEPTADPATPVRRAPTFTG
jgi:hypothetical protein